MHLDDDRKGVNHAINLRWLTRLRWGAIVGQALVILLVQSALAIPLPLVPLFAVVGVEVASNVLFEIALGSPTEGARSRLSRVVRHEWTLGAVLALDVVLLTVLLHLSGGSFNPFNFLYLVHIALAAVVLSPRTTWGLVGLSLLCFASLFWPGAAPMNHLDHGAAMAMHLQGMWVAFAVAAVFIVYFVGRIRSALAERDRELAAARERGLRSEKMASLATLAAGAAHELSTPLSTIHLAAAEMTAALARGNTDAVAGDAELIREQVARCRTILEQLSDDVGASRAESPEVVAVGELVRSAMALVQRNNPIELSIEDALAARPLRLPARATAQAVKGLVDNACDASEPGAAVRVRVTEEGDACRIGVRDEGNGMPSDVLARAGEPFFTTKDPGQGMGLGLFLARSVAEQLGGRLELDSQPGRGTTACLVLPLSSHA